MRIWLNGLTTTPGRARISPFDRGFMFGDGVYEVVRVIDSTTPWIAAHVERLKNSLARTSITGFDAADLQSIGDTLIEESGYEDGFVYLQVTRGCERLRAHLPTTAIEPTVFGFIERAPGLAEMSSPSTVTARTVPDERWKLGSVKSISLLGHVMAALAAQQQNADEAILHRGGFVGEGTRTNVFALIAGTIVTPPLNSDPPVLPGVTRAKTIALAQSLGMRMGERPLRMEELKGASEVWLTSTRRVVSAVVEIDGKRVGDGAPGKTTCQLFEGLKQRLATDCAAALHSIR
jgi:D-alanine transaminase